VKLILKTHRAHELTTPISPRSAMLMIRTKYEIKSYVRIRALKRELNTIINSEKLDLKTQHEDGEPIIGAMEQNKIKLNSEGGLNKFKLILVFRGDKRHVDIRDMVQAQKTRPHHLYT
jgi:hypothetical protein